MQPLCDGARRIRTADLLGAIGEKCPKSAQGGWSIGCRPCGGDDPATLSSRKLDRRSAFPPSLGAGGPTGRRHPASGALEIVRAVSGPTTNPEVFACFWRFAA